MNRQKRLTSLLSIQLKDAVIHGTASEIEFTTLEALKLVVLESLGAEQVPRASNARLYKH